ncbi:IclR family transcriptional regulator PcaU [Acinetobacter gerneri]|jgi:IclR family pca regulon transcriptional regulator|uniref:IclR family transcriptional regulator PcaU n=1 Tax=Acinetobacter gerneri TaxID=202952 RepID=A0AAW8JKS0_9GAMM|nr:IclR family transcriptional regulator PcaU [Acinetobacter gerneri]MCH4245435.1 IclR family transcriptional regulator PcaU [Acinetobacter gerneri]MDQ9010478.1 IclR family transcriptional regulator PcaU [Acinetobacter gerneri]MDQ9014677.1 IclR family transcriptional regulator PcaU [Acinetobacter gerneri]MDQ9025848.1 IclR family transcriptional regulator PcaU [Acinetobacter gerneri]MDQ9053129.1 IclR family transcriptional regulator PcaU [Acinetobacter gerneri]
MEIKDLQEKKTFQNPDNQKSIRHEDFVAGVSKGMAILECFGSERHRLNISIAAEKTGLTRAAARRHLLTLEYLGYLDFDGHYYYLTPKVLKFSGAYLSGAQLPKICQPLLNLLTTQTSLIFSVMVLDGLEAITIARSAAHQQTDRVNPYGLHLGNRLPAHATSAGKILLAHLESNEQKQWLEKYPLKRLTKYSCTDNEKFLEILEQIKEQDWCYSSEEHELGVHALAVPIYGPKSNVVAALNIVSPTMRTTKQYLIQQILPLLQETARELRNVI